MQWGRKYDIYVRTYNWYFGLLGNISNPNKSNKVITNIGITTRRFCGTFRAFSRKYVKDILTDAKMYRIGTTLTLLWFKSIWRETHHNSSSKCPNCQVMIDCSIIVFMRQVISFWQRQLTTFCNFSIELYAVNLSGKLSQFCLIMYISQMYIYNIWKTSGSVWEVIYKIWLLNPICTSLPD